MRIVGCCVVDVASVGVVVVVGANAGINEKSSSCDMVTTTIACRSSGMLGCCHSKTGSIIAGQLFD